MAQGKPWWKGEACADWHVPGGSLGPGSPKYDVSDHQGNWAQPLPPACTGTLHIPADCTEARPA